MKSSAIDSASGDGARRKEVTGRMVLICLVAFFAAVTAVNAIMIAAAVSTFGGVDTDNAYQAGLAFDREAAAARAQDALHWRVQAKVSPREGVTLIEVVANDAADRPLTGLQASARLAHPADRRADHAVRLEQTAPGRFAGTTEAAAGQWTLEIELLRAGSRVFRSDNRVFLR
ncbi:MAG TPA: FixH family protein [Xanthobacteraceae bacterium]|jgi:nitrogen fixation protein FixH